MQLQRLLDELTAVKLTMLDPAERPSQYSHIMTVNSLAHMAMGQFSVPTWWKYQDEGVQEVLEKLYRDLVDDSTTAEVVKT